jgi:tryptophan-rich sensory protein
MVLIGFVGLCLLVATADAVLTEPGMRGWYPALRHPPGTPPNWLFPVVWIPLYVAMGIAAWRIWRRTPNGQSRIAGFGSLTQRAALRRRGLLLWAWQLAFNAIWTPVFFGLHRPVPALAIIVALALLIALTLHDFGRIDRIATLLMTPYLVWVCYACWLNAGIAWLNPG